MDEGKIGMDGNVPRWKVKGCGTCSIPLAYTSGPTSYFNHAATTY